MQANVLERETREPIAAVAVGRSNMKRSIMNVLFIGGTGNISAACTQLAVSRGIDVTLLNRSKQSALPGAKQISVDISDSKATEAALSSRRWDAVVDFIAFTPADIEQRLALFRGRVGQYIFLSSASCYKKPAVPTPITESTPLENPFWQYSRDKIACEERLLRAHHVENFPTVVVRPSLTYGDTIVPLPVNSWQKSYTAVDRMRRGLPVIVPGDGLTLWTITHNSDFARGLVGLLGQERAAGEVFHITSDEALTWNQYYQLTAEAARVPSPKLVHIASDFITTCLPEMTGTLLGDKSHTAIFDNSKIRRFVPDFRATVSYREGIARTIAWFDADERRREIDHEVSAKWDNLVSAYEHGLDAARKQFAV